MKGYAVIIEEGESSFGAYAPELPGCVAVGSSVAEVQELIREAIEFHLEGMELDGDPIPEPTSVATMIVEPVRAT